MMILWKKKKRKKENIIVGNQAKLLSTEVACRHNIAVSKSQTY